MSDLISRSALIKVLKDRATNEAIAGYMTAYDVTNSIIDEVEKQPTAYDVEKVVENIKNIDASQNWNSSCEECINHTTCKEIYNEEAKTKSNHLCSQVIKKLAIEEVRKDGAE